jgi:hypothetical protein
VAGGVTFFISGTSSVAMARQMPIARTYISSYFHCVFSTKERRWVTFQEEFLALLKKHRVEYDEQYLWK